MQSISAEVGCDAHHVSGTSEERKRRETFDREHWPSGSRPTSGTCSRGFIRGTIFKGDYEKVREFYSGNHPFLYSFVLTSPG
jgi:hypothetical protein